MDLQMNEEITVDNIENKSQEENKWKKRFKRIKEYVVAHKARVIIISVLLVSLIAVGVGFMIIRANNTEPSLAETPEVAAPAPSGIIANNILDGLSVDQNDANRHPLAVIVENHTDARPQSGLDKASVVYEAIAEGGITRFMALFSSFMPEKVGPVRSVRTFFVDWAHGFNAYIAHVGGNIDALDKIKAEKSYDLDQFAYSSAYWRERSGNVASEHTMYASTPKLWQQAEKNGYSIANEFKSYKFKDEPVEAEAAALPESQKVSVNFSNASYNVYFQYDKATNSYKRFLAGKSHIDNVTKNQIAPKNLIVMTVARRAVTTRINEAGFEMTTVGSGKAQIFVDGKATTGTWKKSSAAEKEVFYDATGAEMTFNRGQFWISVIPPDSSVIVE